MEVRRPFLYLFGGFFVVLFILIALPSTFRSRMSTNENATMVSCRKIAEGQALFHEQNRGSYADSFEQLHSQPSRDEAPYLEKRFVGVAGTGYTFTMTLGGAPRHDGKISNNAWSSAAWPVSYRSTGVRSFYVDESGHIRSQDMGGKRGTPDMAKCD